MAFAALDVAADVMTVRAVFGADDLLVDNL